MQGGQCAAHVKLNHQSYKSYDLKFFKQKLVQNIEIVFNQYL